jgi:hypothetical protein
MFKFLYLLSLKMIIMKTKVKTKRLIYFQGHPKQNDSAHIVKICADYTTFPTPDLECSWRTVANLYNLQTVRGNLINGELDLESSMSGPHHYYGNLDPTKHYTLEIKDSHPLFKLVNDEINDESNNKFEIENHHILVIKDFNWIKGTNMTKEQINRYKLINERPSYIDVENSNPVKNDINNNINNNFIGNLIDHYKSINNVIYNTSDNSSSVDSLFAYPGVLELNEDELNIPLLIDPQNYDLSSFSVQVVKNDQPFAFNQDLVRKYQHAQHKLRVITYNYGSNYVKDYLMNSNGMFLEKHQFIQSITPSNEECGGYVLIGRYINKSLEIVRICIPYGYTLLVDAMALHGDSGLIGTYIMSMTGDHHAMGTADTVYLKNKLTCRNVRIVNEYEKCLNSDLLLTSNQLSLQQLRKYDVLIKKEISSNVMNDPDLTIVQKFVWQPVILTPYKTLGWSKTLGIRI